MATSTGQEDNTLRLRSYQAEMVEESLKTNIIVVMDTGSGKTHIALARTAAELETCHPSKLVWFLSPTVALCNQQSKVFESYFPAFGVQDLAGREDIDHWSDQRTWDAVFDNVRIVVSTPQVLLDALYHGFVQTKRLALVIFDEAHHCTQKHPANKLLRDFFNPLSGNRDSPVDSPKVLGLSASPVVKANATSTDLQIIETNMNAIAKSPKLHRTDLLRFVHRPQLLRIDYAPTTAPLPPFLAALKNEYRNYDLEKDPYVLSLLDKHSQGHDVTKKLENVFQKHETYCLDQLKGLVSKAVAASEELGPSVAKWYLRKCIARFDKMWKTEQQLSGWIDDEKLHLSNILRRLPLYQDSWSPGDIIQHLTPKVEALIDLLVNEAHSDFTGLVFIEQRVWVAALFEILAIHPKTRHKFRFGTFVGASQSTKRKTNISSIVEPRNQQQTLDNFRIGDINVILATSVLEEGIDVSSCHLVICFERPKNLKSFIQRRGRARKQQSKYYIFEAHEPGSGRPVEKWEALEEEMKRAYLDDKRHIEAAKQRECTQEQSDRVYRIESTGALLTLENAPQHLHHFCATVTSKEYVDTRPQFSIEEIPGSGITAHVKLPLSVDAAVRMAKSRESWKTEGMAIKDASFEAYKALHEAGLVNNNLLPNREEADDEVMGFQIPDNTPKLVMVESVLQPWLAAANHVQTPPTILYRTLLELRRPNHEPFYMQSLTPMEIPKMQKLNLHWNETSQYSVSYFSLGSAVFNDRYVDLMRKITDKLLRSVSSGRMQTGGDDFVWLFVPSDASGALLGYNELLAWHDATSGGQTASQMIARGNLDVSKWGLISKQGDMRKFLPRSIPQNQLPANHAVEAIRFPKRRDFLHAISKHNQQNEAYTAIEDLVASQSTVSNLPADYTIFALFAPSIAHTVELYMIADKLRTSLLAPVQFQPEHIPLILQALTASSTSEETNYQRLEFLGDCILKYIASVHLMSQNPYSPESFLTGKKGKIVSNGFAARSAMSIGLDKFILVKRFTGLKWTPLYMYDLLSYTDEKREMSSKVLADVVESLIGASYVVGGFTMAQDCVRALLPSEPWTSLDEASKNLYDTVPSTFTITNLSDVEKLIGYTFNKKVLLLQALTHPDYHGPVESGTYERVEFLGDAVLDYIISKRLYAHTPALPHTKMHSIRTAMANASFLAFRMFETTIPIPVPVLPSPTTTPSPSAPQTNPAPTRPLNLSQVLRFTSPILAQARATALTQHTQTRSTITAALTHSPRFPWHLLALTDAPKYLSDIVESVLGAVFIDSGGDIAACEALARTFGIVGCLEDLLRRGVDCLHPKERLGVLAGNRRVAYVRVFDDDRADAAEGGGGNNNAGGVANVVVASTAAAAYKVQVKVGGVDVGGVVEGLKRLNAETMAAWEAVAVLERENAAAALDGAGEAMDVDGAVENVDVHGDDDEEDEWFSAEEELVGGVN